MKTSLHTFFKTQLTPATRWILGIEIGAFLLYLLLGQPAFVRDHLMLTPRRAILGIEPWQVLTALVIHADGMAALLSGIGLFALGPLVERAVGTHRFLSLFVACGLAGNIVFALVGLLYAPLTITGGCGASLMGMLAVFGIAYRATPLRFFGWADARADILAWVLIGLTLLLQLMGRDVPGFVSTLAASGLGLLAIWRVLRVDMALDALTHWCQQRQRAKLRRRYTVLEGGSDHNEVRGRGGSKGRGSSSGKDRGKYLN